jgi:RNA polymerase sigma-70 factor (ECF subfamily)
MSGGPPGSDRAEQLYRDHGRVLLAYATSLVVHVSLAEDIVQQVFLKLLKGTVAVPIPERPYLLRAVRNTALNHRRDRMREVALENGGHWLEAPPGRGLEAMAIEAAMRELPTEQREVVVLRVWAGMTYEEIGEVMGCSLNTAASRFRYAKERLRATMVPKETDHA